MAGCPVCHADNPEGARFCASCGSPMAPLQAREVRKTITVLFADVTGSTALGEQLDPETMRSIMGRYFTMMRAVIEGHGGTVEKFIGDAVMAVFGIPQVHEDDALRAVRAAADIATELARLNAELEASRGITIRFRTGVNTGEVVAGDPATSQTLVTGDTVNTAARLEQAAPPGEILLGALTWSLVRDAVAVEPVEQVAAKGKAEPLSAYRLIGVRPGEAGRRRRLDAPLVGRERELARLDQAFRQAVADGSCGLFTLLGSAGVGKSRLVAEFVAGLAGEATILRGHCLSYGEGITYWPIGEIVRSAAGIDELDTAEGARAKLRAILEGEREADVLAARVSSAIGLSAEPAAQEEIFWAIRKLLEHLAHERPLAVVVEDIHWAEPTLLDLLEHIVDWSRDASFLLLCPARPELLDSRPAWGGGKLNATTILLEALPADATGRLIAALPGGSALPTGVVERIQAAAEGNPLYVEELLAMLVDDGLLAESSDGTWAATADLAAVRVPASISALLAARLEQLDPAELAVAERASVVGRVFEAAAVTELADAALRPAVNSSLLALVRKELVRPDRSELTAGNAFRFRHILIRDAAYAALPKAERADLHERFADWLERTTGERLAEIEEIVGHHLEQAYRYRTELGETGPAVERLGERAGERLAAAAKGISARGDAATASVLLGIAVDLPAATPLFRAELLLRHGRALETSGRLAEAKLRAEESLASATAIGDHRLAARARILRLQISIGDGTLDDLDPQAAVEAAAAMQDAEEAGDPAALAEAYETLGIQAYVKGDASRSESFTRLAVEQAWASSDLKMALEAESNMLTESVVGWAPAQQLVGPAESLLEKAREHPSVHAGVLRLLAVLEAMIDRSDDALRHATESVDRFEALGLPYALVHARGDKAWVHRLLDDSSSAERELRLALAIASASGDRTNLSWVACRLVQVLIEDNRLGEIEPYLAEAERVPSVMNRSRVLGARARLHAARGESDAADLVTDLVASMDDIPYPNIRIDGFVDAAEASAAIGDAPTAARYAEEALRLAEAKGNLPRARQVRAIIARMRSQASFSAPRATPGSAASTSTRRPEPP
jgi:class 3 adenylate cyclase